MTTKHNYFVEKRGSQWCVVDSTRTKTLGCHDTEEEANAQLRAIEANKGHTAGDLVRAFARKNLQCTIEGWPIFRPGSWNGDPYTVEHLQQMADAFAKVGFTPPFKLGHIDDPGAPAIGWLSSVRVEDDIKWPDGIESPGLVVDIIDVNPEVCTGIVNHSYGPPSAEIFWDFERNGNAFPRVLGGVALLGGEVPAVAGLPHARDHLSEHATWAAAKSYALPNGITGKVTMTAVEEKVMPESQKELRITAEQMEAICPPCAAKMRELKFKELKIPRGADGKFQMANIPEPMLRGLCDKYGPAEGFRTRCMDNPPHGPDFEPTDAGALCNDLKGACGMMAGKEDAKTMTVTAVKDPEPEKKPETVVAAEKTDQTIGDGIIVQLQKELGLQAEDTEAFKKRLLGGGFVERKEYEAAQAKLAEHDKQETARKESERQRQVQTFSTSIISPRIRSYLTPIYDALTGGPKVAKFARSKDMEGKTAEVQEDVEVAVLLKEFVDFENRQTKRLFGEVATAEITRPERPAEIDPRAELDKRIKDYAKAHNLDLKKLTKDEYKKVRDEILSADPVLKEAYAKS